MAATIWACPAWLIVEVEHLLDTPNRVFVHQFWAVFR
jgi:hypothetical protein